MKGFSTIIFSFAWMAAALPCQAQSRLDTTFSWRGYRQVSTCRVQVFSSARSADRPFTIVLGELAENEGRSTLEDAPHLVELLSRTLRIDPDSAFWIFHWGAFSFPEAGRSQKELFLRATFRRSTAGSMNAPSWRLVTREAVREYTDRAFW